MNQFKQVVIALLMVSGVSLYGMQNEATTKAQKSSSNVQLRGPVKLLATLCFGLATLGQANAKCYSVEGTVNPSGYSVTVNTPLCHPEPDHVIEKNIKRATVRRHPMMAQSTIDIASLYVECPETCINGSRAIKFSDIQFAPML